MSGESRIGTQDCRHLRLLFPARQIMATCGSTASPEGWRKDWQAKAQGSSLLSFLIECH